MSEVHQSMTPIRSPQDGTSSNIRMICGNKARKPELIARYSKLESVLNEKEEYSDPVYVNHYAPSKPHLRYCFTDRYSLLSGVNKAVLMDMYQHLTGDVSSTSISQGVQDRLQLMLDSQNPDVCFDLRHHNTGRPEMFEDFWKAVEGIINENALKAVDSRRHGIVCHIALALSVRDLRNKVVRNR